MYSYDMMPHRKITNTGINLKKSTSRSSIRRIGSVCSSKSHSLVIVEGQSMNTNPTTARMIHFSILTLSFDLNFISFSTFVLITLIVNTNYYVLSPQSSLHSPGKQGFLSMTGGVIEKPDWQVICEPTECPEGSFMKNDCTCTAQDDPCSACPSGTFCQLSPTLTCIGCNCGFCDSGGTDCCEL